MAFEARDTTPSSTCYNINGVKSPFDSLTYIPCNLTAVENGQHSACCAPNDLCLTNGLCKYNDPNPNANYNEYWRVACTDPTYQDPACPKQCANIERDDPKLPTHLVFQCPGDGKWCCATGNIVDFPDRGTVNTTCCDISDLAFDDKEAVVYTTAKQISLDLKTSFPSTTSTQRTSTADATQLSTTTDATATSYATSALPFETGVVSATSSPTSTAAATHHTSSKSIALGVGFGVGIPLGCAVLIAIVFLILRYRRLSKARRSHFGAESHEDVRRAYPHAFWVEPGGREMPVELDAKRDPVEVWSPTSTPKEGWTPATPQEAWVRDKDPNVDYVWPPSPRTPSSQPGVWDRGRQNGADFNAADVYR